MASIFLPPHQILVGLKTFFTLFGDGLPQKYLNYTLFGVGVYDYRRGIIPAACFILSYLRKVIKKSKSPEHIGASGGTWLMAYGHFYYTM